MLPFYAFAFGAIKISRAARQHPLMKKAMAVAGLSSDDDGMFRHANSGSPWNYIPESPNPSLIDVYHRQYDFNTNADVDTTTMWNELKSGADSQLARNNYTPISGNARVQAGPNADDYAWYQEKFGSIHIPYTGSTLSAESSNIWFEAYVKNDVYTECQWFIGFSQYEGDASSFTVPSDGFGFYQDSTGGLGFMSASASQTEDLSLGAGTNNATRLQFHAYIGTSEVISVDGQHVFFVIEVFKNHNKIGQVTLNDMFPYDTDLYLTMHLKTLVNTTNALRLFHVKQLNEKPGT